MTSADPNPIRPDELALVAQIKGGAEEVFVGLVKRHHAGFLRLALSFLHDQAAAEEIVQETWLVALERIAEFEGRSSLKTWLCGILINQARNRRRRDQKTVPESALAGDVALGDEPAVPPDRFSPPGHRWDGHWCAPPTAWPQTPETAVLSAETRRLLEGFIATLPEPQRQVLVLRDVEGLSSEEVCNALSLSDTHQRVLLHRARSRLRGLLERHHLSAGSRPS